MKPDGKEQRTTMVPVTTMEEVRLLSPEERAALIASLEEAEARIKAGEGIEYEPAALKDRLLKIYRKGKRAKGA
jgi:hypothetical protein